MSVDYARPHFVRPAIPSYTPNMATANSNTNANTKSARPTYNDSFDQPAEPFECDVSAILPIDNISNTSILSGTEIDNDSFAPSSVSYLDNDPPPAPSQQQQQLSQDYSDHQPAQHQHASYTSRHEPDHHAALGPRYLGVESTWYPVHEEEDAEYPDDQEERDMFQQELMHQQQQLRQQQQLQLQQQLQQQQHLQQSRNLRSSNNNSLSHNYNDDEPMSGHARLSTIAELSELPSINNITNNRYQSHRITPPQSGQVVISRDLVLEDLYVEGQDDNKDDEIRRQLMANLKPTDILGPLHETHDFRISSLTGTGPEWERQDPHEEQGSDGSLIREEGESDLSSNALALKREYEALFGSRGAVDSERSGSDVTGLMGYQDSADLYQQDEDDEDDDFFGEDDEDDEQEEEYYAMLDLNGGNGNMILGNNIPRKPRVLAPPPGSRLPVPGSANKQNVPMAPRSNIATRLPAPKTSPPPQAPTTPPPPQQTQQTVASSAPRAPLPTTGLRMPQVTAKRASPSPSTSQAIDMRRGMISGSILEGLWREPEYDSQPEESPGAIFAAKVAKELMKEKRESQLREQVPVPKPSMLRPLSKIPPRSMPENDIDLLTQMLKVESIPSTHMDTPETVSSIPRARSVAASAQSSLTPPKISSQSVATRSITPIASAATTTARPSALPTSRLSHKPSLSSIARSTSNSATSSSQSIATNAAGWEQLPVRTSTPTRSLGVSASKTRPASVDTATADRSPVVSRVASPISTVRLNGLRSSIYEEASRDVSSEEPPRVSSNKASVRGKAPAMEDTLSSKERPEDPIRRSSHDRKRQLQRELEEIEAEEAALERRAAEEAASVQDRRSATPRKLTVRTEPREPRRSNEQQQQAQRRSSERERERERDSAITTSPLSPRSPPPRSSGVSSKRSSLYGAHGDRLVPTLEESCKQLAKIRQDIVELREEIHQDQPGSSPLSATARMSTSKRPIGRERGESSRRNSLDGKYTRESSRPQHGRSESFDSNEPSSPENRMSPPPRRRFFGDILGKLSRNVLHSSTMGADLGSSQRKASPTHRKGQVPHSMSHPQKPSRTTTDPEPTHRTSTYTTGRTSVHRQQSQPLSPMSQKYSNYEDRHHSGSSGQSEEFLEDLAYDQRHPYPAQVHRGHQQQLQQQHRHQQHQEQQQQQHLASNQYAHHFRQAHDGSLILSEWPLSTEGGDGGCPAQIRPKELRFSYSVAGEVQSFVTLFNRSRRTMHFEILRPAGITVTPSYGLIQPGRDQRLTIHLAEKRGPGRVVVELDGEWLVPFGVSFE